MFYIYSAVFMPKDFVHNRLLHCYVIDVDVYIHMCTWDIIYRLKYTFSLALFMLHLKVLDI